MNASRHIAAIVAPVILISLAACGGGGGAAPPANPGGPPPSSGGPSPSPTASASPHATASPSPAPSASATPQVNTSLALSADEGPQVNGILNPPWYTAGTTASWSTNAGDTSAGATGASAVDGISCTATTEPAASTSTYSVHSFLGIYYNGKELAIPTAIGMQNPVEPTKPTPNAPNGHPNDTYEVEAAACEYNVHTHDYSGLIHIEDTSAAQSTSPASPLSYAPTLQSLLDIWGVQLSANGLTVPGGTNLTGPTAIYYGTQGTDLGPHGAFLVDKYQQVSSAGQIPLAFHDTAWIVIGAMPAGGLPEVEWRVEY